MEVVPKHQLSVERWEERGYVYPKIELHRIKKTWSAISFYASIEQWWGEGDDKWDRVYDTTSYLDGISGVYITYRLGASKEPYRTPTGIGLRTQNLRSLLILKVLPDR